ncbi:MAG: hypothetical protein CMI21_00785 [Opitutae bacterium]|jgi:hypothetical protein|nr:hypothetical protein [Opitutae bacterium]|tara:strand:- start:3221 stop:3427 length:207 start_codon:yes stop_codon:yes gene_type:complete
MKGTLSLLFLINFSQSSDVAQMMRMNGTNEIQKAIHEMNDGQISLSWGLILVVLVLSMALSWIAETFV